MAIVHGLRILHESLTPVGIIGGVRIVGGKFAPIITVALARAGRRSASTARTMSISALQP
ncbi:hypothetical protein [Actinomyces timonensis]|uniref:hypothetical protein n=1 Tax=Actinomyces timonensis TaxID=1288391 RepID=UPI0002DE607E|nr:hypothetical protein [Actinomyces timonensis]